MEVSQQGIHEIHAAARWVRRGGRKCGSCKANVLFAKNATTGRWQVLDWLPSWAKGNVMLMEPGRGEALLCEVVGQDADGPLYLDHHATCQYADRHRERT